LNNDSREYLVSYGSAGDFSRFRAQMGYAYQRGDRVVIRSQQGLELGVVMCPATPGHARYLSDRGVGDLLRRATSEDEQVARQGQQQAERLFEDARRLAADMALPLEILDVEVLFDRQQAIIHHLRRDNCDYRPLVSQLSRKYDLFLTMQNLALPMELTEEETGCGRPDCGKGAGGCSTCGSGGGCSTGSCSSGVKQEEITAYLAGLHDALEARGRKPLL
jgi:hypothetical protein